MRPGAREAALADLLVELRVAADTSRAATRDTVDRLSRERAAVERERRDRPVLPAAADPVALARARERLARGAREAARREAP